MSTPTQHAYQMDYQSIIHSMAKKVIGGYINANEYQNKEDASIITAINLDESIFENTTHRAIVRAINKLKASGAEICDLNVLAFLERHKMPRNASEGEEILSVMSEYAITPKSFQGYLKALRLNRASKVAI